MDVVLWKGPAKKVAEAEALRRELTCVSRQQAAETLKRRLEQRGADFYERQRLRQTGKGATDGH